jgi:hypothetical protein
MHLEAHALEMHASQKLIPNLNLLSLETRASRKLIPNLNFLTFVSLHSTPLSTPLSTPFRM